MSSPLPVASDVFRLPVDKAELPEVLRYYRNSSTIILDVRREEYYNYGHLKSAINLPEDHLGIITDTFLNKLHTATVVIIYGNGVADGSPYKVADFLLGKGLSAVKVYADGWPEWRSCDLPMVMSEQMKKDILAEPKEL